MSDTDFETATGPVSSEGQVVAFDRRRAGRKAISPVLVPILRDPAVGTGALDRPALLETPYRDFIESDPFHDPMAPARGIVLGLSVSMLFWGFVGYMIFR
jgi:hypothetical protein